MISQYTFVLVAMATVIFMAVILWLTVNNKNLTVEISSWGSF